MTLESAPAKTRKTIVAMVLAGVLGISLVLLMAAGALAGPQWGDGGVPVAADDSERTDQTCISDGAGGCFVAWFDEATNCIKAQRLDPNGQPLWKANGIFVEERENWAYNIQIVADGEGGVLVSYTDQSNYSRACAQRLNGAGKRMWGDNGVVVYDPGFQYAYGSGIVAGPDGGAVLLIYCQGDVLISRTNGSGQILWGPTTIAEDCNEYYLGIVRAADGFIAGWTSSLDMEHQVYTQKYDFNGVAKWGAGGTLVCNNANPKFEAEFTSDGADGILAIWTEDRPAKLGKPAESWYMPYAQRINASGARKWGETGARVSDLRSEMHEFEIEPDGSGGALVSWLDAVPMAIYGQKMSPAGKALWGSRGVKIHDGDMPGSGPVLVSDGSGGMIVAYDVGSFSFDLRLHGQRKLAAPISRESSVYVQQVLASGKKSPGWAPDGVRAVSPSISKVNFFPEICTDGTGGAIITFTDGRRAAYGHDVYAQRMKTATAVWYLAEGSTAWGFSTSISVQNPNSSPVEVRLTYMLPGDGAVVKKRKLPAASQTTINPMDDLKYQTDFSTKIECLSGLPIAVERSMAWTGVDAPAGETHSSVGVNSPSQNWYLAEGCSGYGFETWLLVQNPTDVDAACSFTYMIEGGTPKKVTRNVPGRSRQSFNIAEDIGAESAATMVKSDVPVIVERSMYRNGRREGHETVGAPSASTDYFLAEGSTAWGFTTYVLVQNPNNTPCFVNLTYMTPGGPKSMDPFSMPAFGRATVRVNDQLPNSDFSTQVHSDKPVVAERAMYWTADDPALGGAAHDTVGLSSPAGLFYFPGGATSEGAETFTLVQNPNPDKVKVKVTYMKPSGKDNVTFNVTIPAMSRVTLNMADKIPDGDASTYIEVLTPGAKVMSEHAMYREGRTAGSSTIGGASD